MTAGTLLGIAGLALLDSLNPATIISVTLILLAAPRRPGLIAGAAVIGAAATVFAAGTALFVGAGAATGAVDGIIIGLRILAFGAAGVSLVVAGLRRFRDRARKPISLPPWFTAWTALPFGVLLTGADLPNAFPYFIAIERMVAADITLGTGLLVLAGYATVYCLPCLILLAVGLIARDRVTARLQSIVTRFSTGTIRRSIPIAITLIILGAAIASIPFWLL